ncbi:hypothetical protein KIPB_002622 [Kipferlia bialata]|uniref:Uncharacterized protein n=1 Tax=Kipferlia bialata TaxID=797122 RepID=A0A9K3CU46_9EUKA|nr:hypothetical protein KIPB_002622 [Kipferlia bialata]|eukprot:g2622.t1
MTVANSGQQVSLSDDYWYVDDNNFTLDVNTDMDGTRNCMVVTFDTDSSLGGDDGYTGFRCDYWTNDYIPTDYFWLYWFVGFFTFLCILSCACSISRRRRRRRAMMMAGAYTAMPYGGTQMPAVYNGNVVNAGVAPQQMGGYEAAPVYTQTGYTTY